MLAKQFVLDLHLHEPMFEIASLFALKEVAVAKVTVAFVLSLPRPIDLHPFLSGEGCDILLLNLILVHKFLSNILSFLCFIW